ncbi:MAG TPA: substrate-binding domain-containing protein [Clostridia bacterium]|nr:substrate-binding domain-containing protein [Clostridia bacterium]
MFLPRGFKIVSVLLLFLGFLTLFSGCRSGESEPEPVKSEQIGVVVADGQDENAQIMKKTMENRFKKDGLKLIWLDSENDEAKQEENIAALLEGKVDVAVIQPLEANAAADLVKKLKQGQVKVITLEKMPPNTPLDGHIMPDFTNAGSLQAQFILDTLALDSTPRGNVGVGEGDKENIEGTLVKAGERPLNSRVLLVCGPEGDKMSEEILAANLALLETSPNIGIKVREIPDGNDETIKSKTIEYLTEESETPGFVLTNEARAGEAVLEFLQKNAMDNRMITVGLGGGKNTALALAAGEHNAEVDTMPEIIANQVYDAAVAVARGEHWPYDRLVNSGDYQVPLRLTPVRLIKPENVFLLEERWGDLAKQAPDSGEKQGPVAGEGDSKGEETSGGEKNSGGDSGGQGDMTTTIKIETIEGKTYEMQVDGLVKSIESSQNGNK